MRNANGAGTCYRLKGNRRKPYIARAFKGWESVKVKVKDKETGEILIDESGNPVEEIVLRPDYQTIGYFESKQEGNEALVLHKHNPVSPKATMTLEKLYEEWSDGAFEYIGRDTQNNYRAAWKHLSEFKTVKVKEIRTAHFQKAIDTCHKKEMSRSTLEKIRIVAVSMMGYAVQNDIVNKNYAEFIKLPKADKQEKDRFTDLEIKKLLDRDADEWTSSILIMIYTGMRISEMLGLTRFNVDLKQNIITGGIKTDAGKNRVIPIHPKILPYIKHWHGKNGQALICEDNGKGTLKPLSAKRYREKYYYPALETAKIRLLTPHKCRHTFCTMLAEAGADTVSIQKLAGHTDYAFTANEYTHPEIEKLRKAISQI